LTCPTKLPSYARLLALSWVVVTWGVSVLRPVGSQQLSFLVSVMASH
jgi:hypothetical protein